MRTSQGSNRSDIIRRSSWVFFMFVFFAVVGLCRIVMLQTVDKKTWQRKIDQSRKEVRPIKRQPIKGNILSADGRVLASSVPYYIIAFDPQRPDAAYLRNHIDSFALAIAPIINEKPAALIVGQILSARKTGDSIKAVIKELNKQSLKDGHLKLANDAKIKALEKKIQQYISLNTTFLNHFKMNKLKAFPFSWANKPALSGLIKKDTIIREHPFDDMARRTIGSDDQGYGSFGLEAAHRVEIGGKPGTGKERHIGKDMFVLVEDGSGSPPVNGKDMVTSLNMLIQDMAETALRKKLLELPGAESGCLVLMEAQTGNVISIVNLGKNKKNEFVEKENYAVKAHYGEPGSTFKLATMMALSQDGLLNLDQYVTDCQKTMMYKGQSVSCTHAHGPISMRQIFEKSCNVGVFELVKKYYEKQPEKLLAHFNSFKLRETVLNQQLLGEPAPFIKNMSHKKWTGRSLAQMAIGYEVGISPIQLLTLYNAVATGGTHISPRLRLKIFKDFDTVYHSPIFSKGKILSDHAVAQMRSLLTGVVENGTAANLKEGLVPIAGKTGTAFRYLNGAYQTNNQTVSFAGYFPANQPKYSCIVMIKGVSGSINANVSAAPVFREVADRVFAFDLNLHRAKTFKKDQSILNKAPKGGAVEDLAFIGASLHTPMPTGTGMVQFENGKFKKVSPAKNTMPNLIGFTLRDAMVLLENHGFNVSFTGKGKVTSQSILPGQLIAKKQRILLNLN